MHVRSTDIIRRASSYEGRPYRHQGRSWQTGVDCAGLVICIGHDLELGDFDTTAYSRRPNIQEFDAAMQKSGCTPVSLKQMKPGDILRVSIHRWPVHCGVFAGARFIHSWLPAKKVVSEPMTLERYNQISSVWRYPE